MKVRHTSIGGRRARIFAHDDAAAAQLEPPRDDLDDDDRARVSLLVAAFESGEVRLVGYPGVDPPDAWDLYLVDGEESLFCCVVVTEECLVNELSAPGAPRIVEGFSLQVVPARIITENVLAAAFEAWMERNFPEVAVPAVAPSCWREADEAIDAIEVLTADVGEIDVPSWITDALFKPERHVVRTEDEAA